MSQCHVHSHLNVMSALLRQQVGLSAGRSTSIHPSFLPTMPVKHPHSTSSTDHAMKCHGDGRCGFVIPDRISVSNYTCIRDLVLQRGTFFHLSLLEWRHLRRIEHDVIASKSACRGDYLYQCYGLQLSHVFTMMSFDRIFGIHWGITATPHLLM